MAILEEIKGLTSDKEYVFFSGQGTKNQQLSQRATLYRIRELGFDRETVSPHVLEQVLGHWEKMN